MGFYQHFPDNIPFLPDMKLLRKNGFREQSSGEWIIKKPGWLVGISRYRHHEYADGWKWGVRVVCANGDKLFEKEWRTGKHDHDFPASAALFGLSEIINQQSECFLAVDPIRKNIMNGDTP